MGLLHHISDSSTCIRTANGQDVGAKRSVMINFKIGSCSFAHKFGVCNGITRLFILGKDFLSCHGFKLGWTDDNKRFVEYKGKVIAIALQAVMDDRIVVFAQCGFQPDSLQWYPQSIQTCSQVG